MKLYELTEEFNTLNAMFEADEIDEQTLNDTLESLTCDLNEKADNIACLIKQSALEADAIRTEELNLAKRRKQKEAQVDYLKSYLSAELQKMGIDKIETARNKISFRASESVEIADTDEFVKWAMDNGDGYLTYAEPKINKTAIKKALKDGVEVNGAVIVKNNNLQVR